jgi:hypothetical protein
VIRILEALCASPAPISLAELTRALDAPKSSIAALLRGLAAADVVSFGIDAEVASVLMIAGAFLWPVWARAHTRTAKERQQMAKRFSREVLRLSLHGTLRPEKYRNLDARLSKDSGRRNPT